MYNKPGQFNQGPMQQYNPNPSPTGNKPGGFTPQQNPNQSQNLTPINQSYQNQFNQNRPQGTDVMNQLYNQFNPGGVTPRPNNSRMNLNNNTPPPSNPMTPVNGGPSMNQPSMGPKPPGMGVKPQNPWGNQGPPPLPQMPPDDFYGGIFRNGYRP